MVVYGINRYKQTENIAAVKGSISALPNMKLNSDSQDMTCPVMSPTVNRIKEPAKTTPAISPDLLPPSLGGVGSISSWATRGVLLTASHTSGDLNKDYY